MAAGDKKVNVSVRVRPLIQREIDSAERANWHHDGQHIQQCVPGTETYIRSQPGPGYTFDFIFGQNANTAEVYKEVVAPILQNSLQGFNGTVLCYGQTSSGKTHTLYGCKLDEGIISLTAQDLFSRINEDKSRTYYIRIGLLEVYNEKVSDLLNEGGHVELKEKNGVVVPKGLKEIEIVSAEDMLNAAKKVQAQRKIGETRMNKESSRSHTILKIIIDSVPNETDVGEVQVTTALLNFVDLAGSEKGSQTGAVGERLKESTFINKSLSTLSQVMHQLSGIMNSGNSATKTSVSSNASLKKSASGSTQFVNFRDSKLTRILQSSLNGNAYISLICNVTPAAVEETHSTLRFAKTAKKIKIEPTKNHGPANATQFRNKIMELENLLIGKNTEVEGLKKQLIAVQKFPPLPHQLSGGGIQISRRKTMCPSMPSGLRNYEGSLDKPLTTDDADLDLKIPSNSNRRNSISTSSATSSVVSIFDHLVTEKGSHDDMGLRFPKFPRIDENENELEKENGNLKQELNPAEEKCLRSSTSQNTSLHEIIPVESRELQEKFNCFLSKFEDLQSRFKTQEDENLALKKQVSASNGLATKYGCLISVYEALSKKFGELEKENSVQIDEIQNQSLSKKLYEAKILKMQTENEETNKSYQNALQKICDQSNIVELQVVQLKELKNDLHNKVQELDQIKQEYVKSQAICQLHSGCAKIIEGLNQKLMIAEAEKENFRSDINKLLPPPRVKPKPSLRSCASQTTSSVDIVQRLRHYKILAQKNEKLLTQEKAKRKKEASGLKCTVTDPGKQLAKTSSENDKLKGSLTFFAEEQERYKPMIKKPVATSDGETQCDILQNLLERAKRGEKGLKFPKGFPNYEEEINETRRLKERVAVLEGWEARCICKGKGAWGGTPSLSYGSMVKPRLRTTNEKQQFINRVEPTPQASGTLLYPQQSRHTQLVSPGRVLQQPHTSGPQGEQLRSLGLRLEHPPMTQRLNAEAQGELRLPPSISQFSQPKPPVVNRQHLPSASVDPVQPVQQRQVPQLLVAQLQGAASPHPQRQPVIPHMSSIFDDVPQKTLEEWAVELQQMIDDLPIPDCSAK